MGEVKERVPVEPFLAWCREREAQILREIDHYPAIGRIGAALAAPHATLVMELGWEHGVGSRRLHRWEHENESTDVDRAIVEDALHHAGVDFYDVYVDVKPPKGKGGRLGLGRRMTDAQVIAAHVVYTRGKLTVREVAELIFERHGHASVGAADAALRNAWRSLGLPLRACAAVNENGKPCGNAPRSGHDHCHTHLGCGWRLPDELVRQARALHEREQKSFLAVATALQEQTPYRSAKWLACQIATIAASEGWHQTQQFGARRKHTSVRAYAQHRSEGVAA